MSDTSTDGIDWSKAVCPNCGEHSTEAFDSEGAEFTEFECNNDNCRCSVFRSVATDIEQE